LKPILSFLKIALPLAFGVFLIWYVFKDLSPQEEKELYKAINEANYFWIFLSMSLGILSHFSRAIRWKYSIQPLGKTPGFWNSFFTVMIGYVANLALPRLGEVTRPALLAKYENLPFNKLFGTILAERVADLIILALIMGSIIFLEFDLLRDTIIEYSESGSEKFSLQNIIIIGVILLLGLVFFILLIVSKSTHPLLVKIREMLRGILEGLQSILKMKQKGYFLMHTAFIWIAYVSMFYVCFFALEATSDVPLSAVLASFVTGSLAIVFVQGGLGVFPIAIMETLILYNVSKPAALALGWILWSSQTIMIIVVGVLSIPLLRLINKNKSIEST
tara:strand:+ start:1642 stop:2640 length:999 start_codon:yes stop_codon:yes gene_type:complete